MGLARRSEPTMKARVLKGGWTWKGEVMSKGDVIDAPSAHWIANRVADGGLVEPITEDAGAASEEPQPAQSVSSVPTESQPEAAVIAPS
jgi:hypothetical protein